MDRVYIRFVLQSGSETPNKVIVCFHIIPGVDYMEIKQVVIPTSFEVYKRLITAPPDPYKMAIEIYNAVIEYTGTKPIFVTVSNDPNIAFTCEGRLHAPK